MTDKPRSTASFGKVEVEQIVPRPTTDNTGDQRVILGDKPGDIFTFKAGVIVEGLAEATTGNPPDLTAYYDKTETNALLDDKEDASVGATHATIAQVDALTSDSIAADPAGVQTDAWVSPSGESVELTSDVQTAADAISYNLEFSRLLASQIVEGNVTTDGVYIVEEEGRAPLPDEATQTGMNHSFNDSIIDHGDRISENEGEVEGIGSDLEELTGEVVNVMGPKVEANTASIAVNVADIESLRTDVDINISDITQNVSDIDGLTTGFDDLTVDYDATKLQVGANTLNIESNSNKIADLETSFLMLANWNFGTYGIDTPNERYLNIELEPGEEPSYKNAKYIRLNKTDANEMLHSFNGLAVSDILLLGDPEGIYDPENPLGEFSIASIDILESYVTIEVFWIASRSGPQPGDTIRFEGFPSVNTEGLAGRVYVDAQDDVLRAAIVVNDALISLNSSSILVNAAGIAANATAISELDATGDHLDGLIEENSRDISNNYGEIQDLKVVDNAQQVAIDANISRINTNESGVANNNSLIVKNTDSIAKNIARIDELEEATVFTIRYVYQGYGGNPPLTGQMVINGDGTWAGATLIRLNDTDHVGQKHEFGLVLAGDALLFEELTGVSSVGKYTVISVTPGNGFYDFVVTPVTTIGSPSIGDIVKVDAFPEVDVSKKADITYVDARDYAVIEAYKYADAVVVNQYKDADDLKLNLTGGSISGDLSVVGTLFSKGGIKLTDTSREINVQSGVAGKLRYDGVDKIRWGSNIFIGTQMQMDGNRIYGLPTPVADDEPATKGYVGTQIRADSQKKPFEFSWNVGDGYGSQSQPGHMLCGLNNDHKIVAGGVYYFNNIPAVGLPFDFGAADTSMVFNNQTGPIVTWWTAGETVTWMGQSRIYKLDFYDDENQFRIQIINDPAGVWTNSIWNYFVPQLEPYGMKIAGIL